MIARARGNAANYPNVEFRLGRIEQLSVSDGFVDLVISNCVINLLPEKSNAFREAFRVLVPGGRLRISDTVPMAEIPDELAGAVADLWACCVAGAVPLAEYITAIAAAGFVDVQVLDRRSELPAVVDQTQLAGVPIERLRGLVETVTVRAVKPTI